VRIKVNKRGVVIGVIIGIAATLSGIVVIQYTEAFYLVVILWIALPVMVVQTVRWLRTNLRRA